MKLILKDAVIKILIRKLYTEYLRKLTGLSLPKMGIDDYWDYLYNNIKSILDKLCPEKTFKFAKNRPAWISNDLINLMKERDRSLQTYLGTRLEIDKKEMRKMRNLVNITVKKARADYVRNQLEIHKNDSKKFWKELNSIIPNKKSTAQNFNNIKDDNQDIIPCDILPSIVNSYFANIGLELDKKLPSLNQIGANSNRIYDVEPLDTFNNIKEEELMNFKMDLGKIIQP